jgi:hypothetical protein
MVDRQTHSRQETLKAPVSKYSGIQHVTLTKDVRVPETRPSLRGLISVQIVLLSKMRFTLISRRID